MKSKHVVEYVGQGIYKDTEGKLWSRTKNVNGDILSSREYETEMTEEKFLESRSDIKFMVEYGPMKISTISLDTPTAQKPAAPVQTPVTPAAVVTPVTPTPVVTPVTPAQTPAK